MSVINVNGIRVSPWSAWGGGILESDRALDAVAGALSKDLAININFAGDPNHYATDDPECTDDGCSHDPKARSLKRTREYLDQGNFKRVFQKHQAKTGNNVLNNSHTGAELCIILTAKAMQFGSKLSTKQLTWLGSVYKKSRSLPRGKRISPMQPDLRGIEQFEKALEQYNNGTPYDLIEPDRTDHTIRLAFERARANVINEPLLRLEYRGPRYFEEGKATPDPLFVEIQAEGRNNDEPNWFPGSPVLRECGECGIGPLHTELKSCAVCLKSMYCEDCGPEKHWETHKKHCASFAVAPPARGIDGIPNSSLVVRGHDPLASGAATNGDDGTGF